MSYMSAIKAAPSQISFDEFVDRFVPMPNTITDKNGFDCGRGPCLYETFGIEVEYVYQKPEKHVWTLLNDHKLVSGRHMENRVGFILCEVSVPPGQSFQLDLMEA